MDKEKYRETKNGQKEKESFQRFFFVFFFGIALCMNLCTCVHTKCSKYSI